MTNDCMRETVREAVAKAIWECADDEVGWLATVQLAAAGETFMQGQIDFCREQADAALSALTALGLAVVPMVPTEAMHAAAWAYFDNGMKPGREWPQVNRGAWQAMIVAAFPLKEAARDGE